MASKLLNSEIRCHATDTELVPLLAGFGRFLCGMPSLAIRPSLVGSPLAELPVPAPGW